MGVCINDKFIKKATEIQRKVSELHLNPPEKAREIQVKLGDTVNVRDYTTMVDQIVEKKLRDRLLKLIPGSTFLGEESGSDSLGKARYIWIVDPTDGTAVFATGGEYYSSSIALIDRERQEVPFGSVFQPARDRQFIRAKGEGYWVREKIVDRNGYVSYVERVPQPSQTEGEPELLVAAHAPSQYADKIPGISDRLAKIFALHTFPDLGYRLYGIRDAKPASGSSALFMCDIANGERHGVVLYFQKTWDFAVGAMYVSDAGCPVTVGADITSIAGGDLEKIIVTCNRNTLTNIAVYANQNIRTIIESRFLK